MNVEEWEEFDKWTQGKSDNTKYRYKSTLQDFCNHHDMTPRELINEAKNFEEGEGETSHLKENPAEKRLKKFHSWLITDKEDDGKGVSKNSARTYWRIIKSFYGKFIHPNPIKVDTPKAPKENETPHISTTDVRKMVLSAPTTRDRAILITAFQSGMNTQEICRLNCQQFIEGKKLRNKINKENNKDYKVVPIQKIRKKTQIRHTTFLGEDAVEAIEQYLAERREKQGEIEPKEPLFAKYRKYENTDKRLNNKTIQDQMRKIADSGGFERDGYKNPVQLKNLRDAFSSILKSKGANNVMVEHWMGHAPPYQGAYNHLRIEDMIREYSEYERFLAIARPSERVEKEREEMEKRFKENLGEEAQKRQELEERVEEQKTKMREYQESLNTLAKKVPTFNDFVEIGSSLEEKGVQNPLMKIFRLTKAVREEMKEEEDQRIAKAMFKSEEEFDKVSEEVVSDALYRMFSKNILPDEEKVDKISEELSKLKRNLKESSIEY